MGVVEVVAVLKDLVLAGVAIGTLSVAREGLSTWRRQLKGTAEFDTARTLIGRAYRLRDAIHQFRSPFISASEFPPHPDQDVDPSLQRTADDYAHVYQARWEPVLAATREFEEAALEAEALWPAAREKADALLNIGRRLYSAAQMFILDKGEHGPLFEDDRELGRRTRAELFGMSRDATDPLGHDLQRAVNDIQEFAKGHLDKSG